MINEAFWIVYLAGACESLSIICTLVIFVSFLIATGCFIFSLDDLASDEELAQRRKGSRVMAVVTAVSAMIGTAIPSSTAVYAGAAQYVAEASEVGETLELLKEAIDEKLRESE